MKDTLYLVIPCYNEEEVLHETAKRLIEKINTMIKNNIISDESKILFVNDGSKDKTWSIIKELHSENNIFSGINLSRNRGHQNALLAGLMTAKEFADMTISLDADLQDDVNVIDKFVEQYYQGSDVVYGVRCSRDTDTFFKRTTALAFYKLMSSLGVDMVYNHADYRLMSKRALEGLNKFREVNLFLRGMVPLVGYKYSIVEYERHERFAGESKYPLKKMIAFALDGITSLSIKPIRIITGIGFTIFFISIVTLIYSIIINFIGNAVTGWTSLTISIWMLGGIQLLCLGVIGEYIGKIYNETKQRPRFIISDRLIENKIKDV
ncbi:putative glycosyltransferase YkoT [Clostridium saccharobutylicum]|uniref:glycosyltransferase family 2 protein n=1 Tax=Clostridium saccharobutylicum TaxID=169679 RepID=UPI000983CD24|nr:glycosyltransferase family 2 protein [Clostridium saccharobutylicum]AQS11945.1 putative glycosyltransferase YkoT [Clostridium saccharobutylicum]MBC2435643.1 glycosyltransferase family 2 protein [Clostridium saccharobutylicum]NSB87052.1 glycosyltransferase involved in cell wall biosynthesis [Clostridium saccharobutylicum]NYC30042.1 glycosyltransferase involved in cell wall biosynthesis [Clostridium saccharobutylicum]OOM18713.1 putative glycosyltransferase YkoT [Clostridium saccharobutylicum]